MCGAFADPAAAYGALQSWVKLQETHEARERGELDDEEAEAIETAILQQQMARARENSQQ